MSVYTTTNKFGNITISNPSTAAGTISITGAGGPQGAMLTATGGGGGATWATTNSTVAKTTAQGKLELTGEHADLVMNGVSLKAMLNDIANRLAILQPNPDRLEKYEALRQAYEHYKTLEALLYEEQ